MKYIQSNLYKESVCGKLIISLFYQAVLSLTKKSFENIFGERENAAYHHYMLTPLLDDKILDWSKLKQIANISYRVEGMRKGDLLQAISPFLMMFSTAIYLKCVKMWHCVVIG